MCTGSHGDVTNLTHAKVVRKRARNWYASLTQEKKDERNKKDRERRKRKEESHVLNKSATNSDVAPLCELSKKSAADLITCQLEVNDYSTLHQGKANSSHYCYICIPWMNSVLFDIMEIDIISNTSGQILTLTSELLVW
uniref:Uncharacterized protein n=1 Tax=Oryza rufipogon TaxID=4529 RepID=A0A0E0RIP3_ORYRU